VTKGRVHATATIKKLGKRLAVVDAEAVDGEGRVLAYATATHSLLP
jgi:acyl-coenzyme A thioesterase PaaI-like protein